MLKVPDKSTQKLLELADFLEDLDPTLYDQSHYIGEGGERCICGWVNAQAGARPLNDEKVACKMLGISTEIGRRLFAGMAGSSFNSFTGKWRRPTSKDAARAVRHLAVTGEVPAFWMPKGDPKVGEYE